MNTSSEDIKITIKVEEKVFVIYDDTQTFIEMVSKTDKDIVSEVVAKIVKDRLHNGKQSSSLW